MKLGLIVALACLGLFSMSTGAANVPPKPPEIPPRAGYVPDESTAIKIAEAILTPIFGEREVAAQRPFKARLVEERWIVTGSVEAPKGHVVFGGVLTAHISKQDGRIVDVFESR